MTCTCHLETAFLIDVEADDSGHFSVYDAECEVVASTKILAYAQLIAYALNKAVPPGGTRCCIVHQNVEDEYPT